MNFEFKKYIEFRQYLRLSNGINHPLIYSGVFQRNFKSLKYFFICDIFTVLLFCREYKMLTFECEISFITYRCLRDVKLKIK